MREVTIPKTIHENIWTDAINDAGKVLESLKMVEGESEPIISAISVFFQNCAIGNDWNAKPENFRPLPQKTYWNPVSFIYDINAIQTLLQHDTFLYPMVGMLLSLNNPANFQEVLGALFKWGESGAFDSLFCKDHLTPRQNKVLPFLNKYWYAFFVVYFGEITDKRALKHAIEVEREKKGKLSDYQKQALFLMEDILSYMDNKLATIVLDW